MSGKVAMSGKDCGNHDQKRKKRIRRICACILIVGLILLIVILLTWAILRPTKPRFILQDVTVFAFNVSSPNTLTSNFQITISSRNPNDNIGIYYDKLDVYATYQNQQITLRTSIPPTYQGHKDINIWSPFVYGNSVPVAPFNGIALSQDEADGTVLLLIKIDGRVRWKVGTIITGRYHLHVNCPAYISFGNGNSVGNGFKYQLVERCGVSV